MIKRYIESSQHSPYKVLLVDDDDAHRKLESEILSGDEYMVVEADCGEKALELFEKHDFDVVLLDKLMPGMHGDEVCKRIRDKSGQSLLPIIIVTGTSDDGELVKSMSCGATDFIRKPYNPAELKARVNAAANQKRLTDQLDSAESMLFALARMVEAKDEQTGDHCSRLEHRAVVFGKELGLSSDELMALRHAGVLHDIGKLGIPDSILLKNGPLDEEEWVTMRQHPQIGATLLKGLRSMSMVVPIVRHHHERFDGSGYPQGVKGEEIPYLARVFQVVDVFDALSSERPYKKAFSREKVVEIFENEVRKGWRDPELVRVFLEMLANDPGKLELPENNQEDLGSEIYEEIIATGVMSRNPVEENRNNEEGKAA